MKEHHLQWQSSTSGNETFQSYSQILHYLVRGVFVKMSILRAYFVLFKRDRNKLKIEPLIHVAHIGAILISRRLVVPAIKEMNPIEY